MNILWITNTVFPEPSLYLGLNEPVVGGWMYGLANQLSSTKEIKIAIATTYTLPDYKKLSILNIDYYLLPCKNNIKYNRHLEPYWEIVCNDFKPDIIHIHGTEYAHGLSCIKKYPNIKTVISIQGLVGVYEKYYLSGMSFKDIFLNITFRDLIKLDTIFLAKKKFYKRGILESQYILQSRDVIGRTKWDFTHSKNINPSISYHFCNESLRDCFYKAIKWRYEYCEPHTIFISQASYPIKGLHQVLKAAYILKKEFPNLRIRVAGENITKNDSVFGRFKLTGYGKFIMMLIKKYNLENKIIFLGSLNERQMVKEYQKANIFICPSSIENSPNSIGEAQLIGVPVIASYVGGVPDLIENNITGLIYRFEEVEMLAEKISFIFNDSSFASQLSEKSIIFANSRHDKRVNLETLISIYKQILINE